MALPTAKSPAYTQTLTTDEMSEASEPNRAKSYRLSRIAGKRPGTNPNQLSSLESAAYARKMGPFSRDVCLRTPGNYRGAGNLASLTCSKATEPNCTKSLQFSRMRPNRRRRTQIGYLYCFQQLKGERRPIFGKMYVSRVCSRCQPSEFPIQRLAFDRNSGTAKFRPNGKCSPAKLQSHLESGAYSELWNCLWINSLDVRF